MFRFKLVPFVAILIVGIACGSDGETEPSPTHTADLASPTATATTATATVAPTQSAGDMREFEIRSAAAISVGIEHLLALGCWACEGNDTGLVRVLLPAQGEPIVETLLDAGTFPGETLQWVTARHDASLLVAVLCSGSNCTPLGEPASDATSRLVASRDGGVTWDEIATFEGYANVRGVAQKLVLVRRYHLFDGAWQESFTLLPGDIAVDPPDTGREFQRPFLLPGGTVLWLSADHRALVNNAGDSAFSPDLPERAVITNVLFGDAYIPGTEDQGPRLVEWHFEDGAMACFVGVYGPDGTLATAMGAPAIARVPECGHLEVTGPPDVDVRGAFGSVVALAVGGAVTNRFPAAILFGPDPVVAVLDQGPFTANEGRNRLIARRGANLRVASDDGCVNVRAGPTITAEVLACYADGVLLGGLGPSEAADVFTWLSVATIDGQTGWIAEQFVERIGP